MSAPNTGVHAKCFSGTTHVGLLQFKFRHVLKWVVDQDRFFFSLKRAHGLFLLKKRREEQGMCHAASTTEEILRCQQFISVFLQLCLFNLSSSKSETAYRGV